LFFGADADAGAEAEHGRMGFKCGVNHGSKWLQEFIDEFCGDTYR